MNVMGPSPLSKHLQNMWRIAVYFGESTIDVARIKI
jgi:hypothetical protein